MHKPEWLVTINEDKQPQQVSFKEMFALKTSITSLTLLWTTSSYHVNVSEKIFIIQGGKRISVSGLEDLKNPSLFYAKRNKQDMAIGGKVGEIRTTYLLGVQGKIDNEDRVVFLEVSDDGKLWRWKYER